MAYRKLSLKGFVQEFKSVSEGPYQRRFCFVLGAGASKTSGIKTGEELVDIWDKELEIRNPEEHETWKKEQGITEKNKYNFYSSYYERRFERDNGKQYRDGYNFLETMMEKAHPSSGYVNLALLMSQKMHNIVITTNFDHLLEDSLVQYAQTMPMVIGHEKLAPHALHQTSRPTVIKIHRDLLLDPINRPGELDRLNSEWEEVLEYIFSQYHPVFVGYAGNDNSVMDFLNQNVDKFNSGKWRYPYWMIYGIQEPEGKVRKFLEGTNGYLIQHKGFDQVFALLCRSVNTMPPDEETFLKKAKEHYEAILDSIEEILKEYKDSATEIVDLVGADTDTDIGSGSEDNSASASYIKSVMLISDGKYDNALAEARKTVQYEPQNARYRNNLGIILHAMHRYDEALAEKEKAVVLEPDNARYHDTLSTTLHAMHRYDEALAEAQKAVELEPNSARYHNGLGITLHAMHRYDEALEEKKKAVVLEPDNARYHDSLSTTLHEMHRYNEALAEAQKAVELEPNNARYHNELGTTLHEMHRYDEALEEKKKAIALEPNNSKYYESLGTTLFIMHCYEESLVETQKAVELEPNNAQYHNSLGITLNAMKRYDEALEEKKKAVKLDPGSAGYHSSLGITLDAMGYHDEAVAEKKKAIALEPDNARYYESLSTTLHEMHLYEEALVAAQKAVELEPNNAKYHNSVGITLYVMGRYDEALKEIQTSVDLSPDNEEYTSSLEILKSKIDPKEPQ